MDMMDSMGPFAWFLLGAGWFLSGTLPFLWFLDAARRMEDRFGTEPEWRLSLNNGILLLAAAADLLVGPIFGLTMAAPACAAEAQGRMGGFSEWCPGATSVFRRFAFAADARTLVPSVPFRKRSAMPGSILCRLFGHQEEFVGFDADGANGSWWCPRCGHVHPEPALGHIPTLRRLRSQGLSWPEMAVRLGWSRRAVLRTWNQHIFR